MLVLALLHFLFTLASHAVNIMPLTVFLSLYLTDMASKIPSIVKRSPKYEDLFGEASGSKAPVSTPPIF